MQISYEQAVAAQERGEKVEMRRAWEPFVNAYATKCEFRIADPYAELKAAQAQGKVIQLKHPILESVWDDCIPNWSDSPDRYRVKPDEPLNIEAGKPRIYVASKTKHAEVWRKLRREGHNVIATWIDEAGEGESASYGNLAVRCIDEAVAADFTILYCEPGDVLKGALLEVGAALAAGKEVKCVGTCESISRVFREHPHWTEKPSIWECVKPVPYDNWQHVPSWAQWQAMDQDGEWSFFESAPIKGGSIWDRSDLSGFGVLPLSVCQQPTNFTGTWENSLQERPKL